MSHEEVIIVPVTLHPEKQESTLAIPLGSSVAPICTMKSGNLKSDMQGTAEWRSKRS